MVDVIKLACVTSLLALSAVSVSASDFGVNRAFVDEKGPVKQEEEKKENAEEKGDDKDEKKDKKKKPKFKKYKEVVTEKAITRTGVFTTHLVDNKAYFEIPEDQLGREFVWQVKVAGIQTKKGLISADSSRQYVYFERINDDIILRGRDYSVISKEGEPETFVVNASDLDAVLAKLPIVTFGEDKTPVIEVTSIFMGKVKGLEGMRDDKMDAKVSIIKNVKSFERNIEARVLGRFTRKDGKKTENITAEIRHSIFALPDDLMKPRHFNHRVGFFDGSYTDFSGEKNKVDTKRYIRRWRLEKKDPSAAMSEPKKPITWYIDRGTPTRYIEAVREGIEFWQSAFEKAGFKNGIVAKMAPTIEEDPDWDPEDARYAVIRWVPSTIPNANGPHVADPRTGEIIEADVRMYHNVLKLLEEWYFAQAGATDPRAKKLPLPDDVMSDLVRFVVAHEVGHSIGLHHNFLGSNAYTVTQLRDPAFVAKNGVASSIMDYARFNYVMQPEDGVSPIDYVTGPYDNFAVEWGYTEFAGDLSADDEVPLLNKIADRQLTNKALRWDSYSAGLAYDPRIQTEDIGDDAMEASFLGMKNLERIMANVVDAASYEDGKTYAEVRVAYGALASQYARELGHVTKYIGSAVYRRELAQGHTETDVYTSYPMEKQKEAFEYVAKYAFKLPDFWKNKEVLKRVGYDFYLDAVTRFGTRPLGQLLSARRIDRMVKFRAGGIETYDPVELFSNVRAAVFEEARKRNPDVSAFRRRLQASMVNLLIAGVEAPSSGDDRVSDDYRALCRSTLVTLEKQLSRVGSKNASTMSGIHFQNLAAKIAKTLDAD